MTETLMLMAFILVAAMLCQWLAWRLQIPAILFLLLTGIIAGPVSGVLVPDLLFGDLLMPMISLSVAIILFEGSLTLNFSELRGVSRVVQRMVSIGALVTWIVVALATHLLVDFSWELSALFGAIVIVTGPTVIMPMLRTVKPNRRIANILRWEGIVIDPIGALMAVVTYEFIVASLDAPALGHAMGVFLFSLGTGALLGVMGGGLLGLMLRYQMIPEYLHNLAVLSIVVLCFAVSNHFHHESGLLAVTVMGMWLANMKSVDILPILNFKENLTLLLISVLFIVLAARIEFSQFAEIGPIALLLIVVMQFVARPLKVLVSTWGTDLRWQEKALLSWIAPRGIVAAAVAAIFAERLLAQGFADARYLTALTFLVIIGTVFLQSITAGYIARWLGVAEPDPSGFLFVGANPVARLIARELKAENFRCVVADSNWESIREARMASLETFYGNPVSDHAELELDLTGIGNLIAVSPQRDSNVIAAIHFRAEFGNQHIFSLPTSSELLQSEKHSVSQTYKGQRLFGSDITYAKIASLMAQGHEVRRTTLTDTYDWDRYRESLDEAAIPLFAIREDALGNRHVQFFTDTSRPKPQAGWKLFTLSLPPRDPEVPR